MRVMITESYPTREADQADLDRSPHRQVSHVLFVLPVGTVLTLTVPVDGKPVKTVYHSEAD